MKYFFRCLVLVALLLSSALSALPAGAADEPPQPAAPQATISLQLVASGLARPVAVTAPTGDRTRLFITEKTGYLRIVTISGGVYTLLPTPFLDIDALVGSSGNEQGLLSVAFHPNYVANGYFYVNYTNNTGATVLARYQVSAANANLADPASAQVLLTIAQPFSNHNGGQLQFGPDGYLYIGMGDGGSSGDPSDRAQNTGELLGKMLRLDVDSGSPYGIPASNPFVGPGNPLDEIWALGVRNPWRFSFDRLTGDLWIGDVGQGNWEEIDLEPAGSAGGRNWGWRCLEGTHVYDTSGNCPANLGTLDAPIYEYSHTEGCSITGGYVYRGSVNSAYFGDYLFADYCASSNLRTLRYNGTAWVRADHVLSAPGGLAMSRPTAFGEDALGNIYMVDDNNIGIGNSGEVYLLQLRPAACMAGNYDLNGDGAHNIHDIQLVAGDWQRADFAPDFDVNCDGRVDILDVQLVATAWGLTL
ncbi:MAG: PQQ-dependent sugar dehydrogenase [Caldilineales bacterium]